MRCWQVSKFRDKVLLIIFIAFLFSVPAGLFLLPREDVSVNEKRTLAAVPDFSVKNILNGKFEKDTEAYLTDHFPFRDELTAVNAYTALYTGRNGANGIYKGKDGYLISVPVKEDRTKTDKNISAMMTFTQECGIPSTLMIVPSKGYIMSDKLPENHMEYRDKEIIDYIHKKSEAVIGYVDVEKEFLNSKEETALYYKTDHHWTVNGAYNAYVEYCREIGYEPLWEFDKTSYDGFYGTAYSKSALWRENADKIELWDYPYDITMNIDDEENVSNRMFFMRHLSEPDKYPVYLDGNHAKTEIINNSNPNGDKLLVIKDSFAQCLVPFLVNHYSEVDMIDLRYYLDPVSELVNEKQYDRILFLFGISSLTESSDISVLE